MNQLNSLILEGNVCKEPEIKEINGEKNLATFSIAVNRYYKKADGDFEQEVSYFDIEAWGTNYVKLISEKAEKGSGVRIVGRLKQNRWQDQNGKWQSRVFVVAEHVSFGQRSKRKKNPNLWKKKLQRKIFLRCLYSKTRNQSRFQKPLMDLILDKAGGEIFRSLYYGLVSP